MCRIIWQNGPGSWNSLSVAKYADTQLNAAVAYDGTENNSGKTLVWGFMLESMKDFNTLYKDCINWLMQ